MAGQTDWILYGANGYTGVLIAEEAIRRGLTPILAGRRAEAIQPLAEKLCLPWRVFSLEDPVAVTEALAGAHTVLLAAGPFSRTSRPVIDACLETGTHYLDITGEISVFEACHARTQEAQSAGVTLLPGVGFDVVPTDCLAARLKEALPNATKLELAFASNGAASRGTTLTAIEGIPKGSWVRREGRLRPVALGSLTRDIPFRDRTRHGHAIPWGDISTAYFSTGIENITVYVPASKRSLRMLRATRRLLPLLGLRPAQWLLRALVERYVTGPDPEARARTRCQLWGRVTDAAGTTIDGTLVTPEGYTLTASAAVSCVERVLAGESSPGTLTPSMAFGSEFVTTLPDCDIQID